MSLKEIEDFDDAGVLSDTSYLLVQTDGVTEKVRARYIMRSVDLRSYGVQADGSDETTLVAQAIADAKANGWELLAPEGTIGVQSLALGGGAKRWALRGQGKGLTIFKRLGGGTVMNCSGSTVPFTLSDFTLDCSYSTVPTGASHGISIGRTSGFRGERISVIDHYASAGQIYDDSGTHQYFDNMFIDCDSSGSGGLGQVGFLLANVDRSHLIRCFSTGCNGSPGYAIEVKNVSHDCHVTDCIASNSIALLALSSDVASPGVERCSVAGFTGKAGASTVAGYFGGYAQFCTLTNLNFDMDGQPAYAIRPQNDLGNSFENVIVKNVRNNRAAVYLDQASTDNYIELAHVANINVTGQVVEFNNNSARNRVVLRRMTTPSVRASGLDTEANFNSTTTNSYEHDGYTMFETVTISGGVATPKNVASQLLILNGEGGAADNLDTITATDFANQGRPVALRRGDADITVTSAGNINTAAAGNFTMNNGDDTYSARWNATTSKWAEVQRSDNA